MRSRTVGKRSMGAKRGHSSPCTPLHRWGRRSSRRIGAGSSMHVGRWLKQQGAAARQVVVSSKLARSAVRASLCA